jgi:hypothetical protein
MDPMGRLAPGGEPAPPARSWKDSMVKIVTDVNDTFTYHENKDLTRYGQRRPTVR